MRGLVRNRVAEGYFPVSWELSVVSFYFFVSGRD